MAKSAATRSTTPRSGPASCPRCHEAGVVVGRSAELVDYTWCACVLGTIQRWQFARRQAGAAPLDFAAFYQQRALPFFRRDNAWSPSE